MNTVTPTQNNRRINSAITPTQNVRVAKVSAVKMTPHYKMISRFSHVSQAVINPSPKKPRLAPTESKPELDVYSNSLKISRRIYDEKELPEHLIKMPIDPNATPKVAKVIVNTQGMTAAQKKQAQDAANKAQKEALKQRMVLKNLNSLFAEIKKALDKPETENLHDRLQIQVGTARGKINGKRFISYLFSDKTQESQPSKQEFHLFMKMFVPQIKEDEVQEIIIANCKNGSKGSMTESQEKMLKLDITLIDAQFDRWIREEETLSGVLNIKLTKTKNTDLKMKFEAWNKRSGERTRIKKRAFDQEKAIRDAFSKYLQNFENGLEPIIECQIAFHNLVEDLEKTRKIEKVEFQLLSQLPDLLMLETSTVEKLIDSLTLSFNADFRVLERFAGWAKSECVMNQYFFNFFDIPDLIVKKQISKKDYEGISKLLLKVKRSYLFHKATLLPDKPIDQLNVTDEDLVPLELFDEVLTQIKHKFDDKKIYWQELMNMAKKEIAKKQRELNIDNEKKKKMIQDSVLVTFLNTKLETQHTQAFDHHFKLQLLYKMLVKGYGEYSSPEELQKVFFETLNIKQSDQNEFKAQLQKELMKFNGKASLNDGIESEQTSVHFAMSGKKGNSPDKIERTDDDMGDRSINELERGLMQMELAEGADEERYNREGRFVSEKEKREAHMKEMFKDKNGVPYDPIKKFGVIQAEGSLLYDNITTSYPLNLPTEYYHDAIKQSMPTNEEKWFIRPHHLESLTQHKASIKDGVLNTHYFSHYNQKHGKPIVRDEPAEAIINIEKVLEQLKFEQMQLANGKDITKEQDQLRKQCEKAAHDKFDIMMNQRAKRENTNALMIEAYEGVLLRNRRREREILNNVRHEEYERNRPPENKWYEFKGNGFNKELYRNRVALKPNNANKVYLERLQDKDIY